MHNYSFYIFIVLHISAPNMAHAFDYFEQYGNSELKVTGFIEDPSYSGQNNIFMTQQIEPSFFIEQGSMETLVKPRLRVGNNGAGRVDLSEAHISFRHQNYDVRIGSITEFWGKTESYNPSDIVNSYDYTSGLASSEKLGAPAFKLSSEIYGGYASFYLFPLFVENAYPGVSSRQRLQTLVSNDVASFANNASRNDNSFAFRYEGYYEDLDYGVSYFDGISREPFFIPGSDTRLLPEYAPIRQIAVDLQYFLGDLAFKTEVVDRSGQRNVNGVLENYNAGVLGIEKNRYGVLGSQYDLVLFGEISADSRGNNSHTIFQRDLTVGGSLLLNDIDDSEISLFLTQDLSYSSGTTRFSYSTRLNDSFTIESILNLYSNLAQDPSQLPLAKDSSANVTFNYNW